MRIALGIEYDGHNFSGWQAQPQLPTVQGHLEEALTKVADHPIQLFCAGRTDAGVHALQQVVHFDTIATRSERAWIWGSNTHLPPAIAVRWAMIVDENFHARFSALFRRYYYVIFNHSIRSALVAQRATWFHQPLDIQKMQAAGRYLIGEQDFSSFRSSACESRTPMRNVHHVNIFRKGDFVVIDIQANAFLHHMVRNITGTLLYIGSGQAPSDWIQTVLHAKDRRKAAETAPAEGLYLADVGYSAEYSFPKAKLLL